MIPKLRGCARRKFAPGSIVYDRGEATDHVFLVVSGTLRVEQIGPDGGAVFVTSHIADDLVGELCLCEVRLRQERAVAVVRAEVVVVRVEDLLDLAARDRDALVGLVEELCHRVDAARRRLGEVGFETGERRIALRVLELALVEGTAVQPGLRALVRRPSQAAIASAAFVSREFTNRVLGELRSLGLVAFERSGPMMVYVERLKTHLGE